MRASVAEPHEHLPLLIDGELLDANELNFHIFQVVVIELKLALECPMETRWRWRKRSIT